MHCIIHRQSLCVQIFFFSGLNPNQEGEAPMDPSECRPWGSPGLSVPLSLCRSHIAGAFSQNSMTLTGLPMILVSESDLTYPLCGVPCHVLLSARQGFSLKNGTTLHVGLSLEYLLHNTCV